MGRSNWYTLDNTAKLIPSMTNNLNTNVFRLSCTLKEEVDAGILEEALLEALDEFPLFNYTMKDGIFWHYLEKSNKKAKVELEKNSPCARLDGDLLFRLSYYKKRINLEVYHVLSDGNGALEFLKFIVYTYIEKKYGVKSDKPLNESSEYEKSSDDFKKFDKSNFRIKTTNTPKAYKLKFAKKETASHDVIEAHMSTTKILNAAEKYNATVTTFLSAVLIKSIIQNARVRDLKKPVGIAVPVDLRNTFPSKTSRNFFYTVSVQYMPDGEDTLEKIIASLSEQMAKHLTKERLQEMLNTYMTVQRIIFIRIVPNFLKDFILSLVSKAAKKGQTMALSNLGLVKVIEPFDKYIDYFTALMSTEDIQLTVVSYKEKLVLGFTSHFINKEIERTMVKYLEEITGVSVRIISNVEGKND